MTRRFEDWPSRLFGFVESRRAEPFAWGSQDCCLFAADAVQAITGVDPAASLRGYTSKAEAVELIAKYGTLEDLVSGKCREMNFVEVAPKLAQRGDLVVFENAGNPALGVCLGAHAAFPGKDGLVFHPLAECRRAWRVG